MVKGAEDKTVPSTIGTVAISSQPRTICTRETFASLLPERPYCADDVKEGLRILSRPAAITKRHVQFNGPQLGKRFLVHDVDHSETYFAHRDGLLPPPNVVAINRGSGRGHCAYMLDEPVAVHGNARAAPLRFYNAVDRGIARRLGADAAYSGLIAKNPLHEDWLVEWRHPEAYSLHALSDWLFPRDMRGWSKDEEELLDSRNCAVFYAVRKWATRNVLAFKRSGFSQADFQDALLARALKLAQNYTPPLPYRESVSIARSVSKWTWPKFTEEAFARIQSERGKRGAKKRWEGKTTLSASKPWAAEGISRRTYFRKKAKASLE